MVRPLSASAAFAAALFAAAGAAPVAAKDCSPDSDPRDPGRVALGGVDVGEVEGSARRPASRHRPRGRERLPYAPVASSARGSRQRIRAAARRSSSPAVAAAPRAVAGVPRRGRVWGADMGMFRRAVQ